MGDFRQFRSIIRFWFWSNSLGFDSLSDITSSCSTNWRCFWQKSASNSVVVRFPLDICSKLSNSFSCGFISHSYARIRRSTKRSSWAKRWKEVADQRKRSVIFFELFCCIQFEFQALLPLVVVGSCRVCAKQGGRKKKTSKSTHSRKCEQEAGEIGTEMPPDGSNTQSGKNRKRSGPAARRYKNAATIDEHSLHSHTPPSVSYTHLTLPTILRV